MGRTVKLIVHGRGNAWPVPLGETHPFYDKTDYRDLANAAFSLVVSEGGMVSGDILVDAGHGTIQSLISGANRIPHCICLTHGHMDHTLSVDWVVQSYWRLHQKEKRYPIYATRSVFRFLVCSYPHLEDLVELRELFAGEKVDMEIPGDVCLTPFPVFHGQSAVGASMLLFETGGRRILFTGDLISPLLREADYQRLRDVDLLVVDSNNRFPWPRTNHWSFAGHPDRPLERSEPLQTFLQTMQKDQFSTPHQEEQSSAYFKQLGEEWNVATQPFTILEFLQMISPRKVALVHYSGAEDLKYYGEPLLSSAQMEGWVKKTVSDAGIGSTLIIPKAGQEIVL
jgi:glyoxylase-like metal-dependent hydrolase (beta-lactamase superfamily II)